jgi:LysM repeat protein
MFVFAAFGVGPVLLAAGCGSEATGSDRTVVEVKPTSYFVEDPVTTTSSTTLPLVIQAGTDPNEQLYTVKGGDSVYGIAQQFGIAPDVLANYNVWPEGINHFLTVGAEIKIPPGSRIPGVEPAADAGTATGAGSVPVTDATTTASGTLKTGEACPAKYTIQAGDTVRGRVATKFGITYQEMDAANSNTPGYASFIPGTEIVIPCPL